MELCPASNGWLEEFLCLALGQSQYAVPIPTSRGCCKRGMLRYRLSFYSVSRFDEDIKSVSFCAPTQTRDSATIFILPRKESIHF